MTLLNFGKQVWVSIKEERKYGEEKKAIGALLPRLRQQTSGHLEELRVPLPTTVEANVWSLKKAAHVATAWRASSTC
jgi:hypothetical protein